MFKHFATSIFMRRNGAATNIEAEGLTRSELQDLFRSEFEVHNRSAMEITARQGDRRPHQIAA